VGESVLKVMRHHGVGMFVPDSQRCCGIPALPSGDQETFQRLLSINPRQFAATVLTHCSVVATGCPACMLQMADMLSQAGDRVRVRRAVEVYAESLD
jgi:glycolate oxidase iron-sulfur subunit